MSDERRNRTNAPDHYPFKRTQTTLVRAGDAPTDSSGIWEQDGQMHALPLPLYVLSRPMSQDVCWLVVCR